MQARDETIVGRLIRSRQRADPAGFPSRSLGARRLHSAKRKSSDWRLTQTPYDDSTATPTLEPKVQAQRSLP